MIEAKKQGATLTGVEIQSARYAKGLPAALPAWRRPLPFVYESTGVETHFTNGLDPSRARARLRVPQARDAGRVAERAAAGDGRCDGQRRSLRPSRVRARHLPRPRPRTCRRSSRVGRPQALARPDHRHPQPGKSLAPGPPARPDPDGHRQRQDLHRHQLHLPADQVRRRAARAVPGGPRQPRPTRPRRSSTSTSRPTTTSSSARSTSSST